eukprot:TRINITY_DN81696_c0_g1_i1.p1 TRINITY_DN81696_c0_g1~~TRINITY_DN81696_c0_g1_i1.p1  ORF type:complete len:381 (+),score=110.69 TRINITY_DN81696_c0_g1_i1:63-1145(+)
MADDQPQERPRKRSKWDDDGGNAPAGGAAALPDWLKDLATPSTPAEAVAAAAASGSLPPGLDPSRFKTVQIPAASVGGLIGKGGETIQQMRQKSGSDIKVNHEPGEAMATVTITGNVTLAEKMIFERIEELKQNPRPPRPLTPGAVLGAGAPGGLAGYGGGAPGIDAWEARFIDVAQDVISLIISGAGMGGNQIKEMNEKSGCKISFIQANEVDPARPPGQQIARVKGPPSRLDEGVQLLEAKVAEMTQIKMDRQAQGLPPLPVKGGCGGKGVFGGGGGGSWGGGKGWQGGQQQWYDDSWGGDSWGGDYGKGGGGGDSWYGNKGGGQFGGGYGGGGGKGCGGGMSSVFGGKGKSVFSKGW